jgi:hypothetical protein
VVEKNVQELFEKIKHTSLGMGWVVCILCWPIAISAHVRFLYFIAGLVSSFAAYVGFSHRHRVGGLSLIVVAALEAWWMFWLSFSSAFLLYTAYSSDPSVDDAVKVMDALSRMIGAINK